MPATNTILQWYLPICATFAINMRNGAMHVVLGAGGENFFARNLGEKEIIF